MPAISKGLTSRITLRMSDDEQKIIERVQLHMAESGVTMSANDVIRHLLRVAVVPPPLTPEQAWDAVARHTGTCGICVPERPPACPEGVRVRDHFVHAQAAFKMKR